MKYQKTLKLSNKAIFCRLNMLRNAGYNFKRLYYSDGNIVYSNGADMAWYNEKNNGVNLITKDDKIDSNSNIWIYILVVTMKLKKLWIEYITIVLAIIFI